MRRRLAVLSLVGALVVPAAVVAQSPSVLPAPTPPVADACALVPNIEALTGRGLMLPYQAGLNVPVGSDVRCIWMFNDHPAEVVRLVGRPQAYADERSVIEITGGVAHDVNGWLIYPDWNDSAATVLTLTPRATVEVILGLETEAPGQMAIAIASAALATLGQPLPSAPTSPTP